MPRPEATPIEIDDQGYEKHPAFGLISAHRVTSQPGEILFDSDLRHNETIVVEIATATRERKLSRYWTFSRKTLIRVQMSYAQWAAFVSSAGTSGVPCTLRSYGAAQLEELPYEPELAVSRQEVHDSAAKAFARIRAAEAAYAALPAVPKKAKDAAYADLQRAIAHATGNIDFVVKSLDEHVENVTTKARADIEGMAVAHAKQLGIEPGTMPRLDTAAIEAADFGPPDSSLKEQGYVN